MPQLLCPHAEFLMAWQIGPAAGYLASQIPNLAFERLSCIRKELHILKFLAI